MEKWVKMVMKEGVGFVCAHCDKFWWSFRRRLDKCKAFHDGKECAGPGKFMAFPEYSGPLKGKFHQYCFVCGRKPDYTLKIPIGHGLERNIGICEKDKEILIDFRFSDLMPTDRPRHNLKTRGVECPIELPKNSRK